MSTIYESFTWTSTDTVTTITYFDPTDDTYPTLELSYLLYDNPDDWTTFDDYVTADSDSVTTNEDANVTAYESYSLRLICDISSFSTLDGSGCCLMDWSSLASGGYCIIYDETNDEADTYYLSDSDFDDALTSTYVIPSDNLVDVDSDNEIGFESFYCTVASDIMTCDHF